MRQKKGNDMKTEKQWKVKQWKFEGIERKQNQKQRETEEDALSIKVKAKLKQNKLN